MRLLDRSLAPVSHQAAVGRLGRRHACGHTKQKHIEGDAPMDAIQSLALVLVGATAFWVYLKLKERIELLEHEVRWLRKELEALKPTEIKSAYD